MHMPRVEPAARGKPADKRWRRSPVTPAKPSDVYLETGLLPASGSPLPPAPVSAQMYHSI